MSIGNSILVAIIVMSIVFSCLIALSFLVKLQSFLFGFISPNKKSESQKEQVINSVETRKVNTELSTGELKIIGVDEKTAAIIMAILSDELEISLDELCFKSIKLINS